MDESVGLVRRFVASGWNAGEASRLLRLIGLFLRRPDPPGHLDTFPDFSALRDQLARSIEIDDAEEIEEHFLELYAHLHMNHAPYSDEEREQMDAAGGYWNHAGGLSPILKAAPWIDETTVSADFGAGNGLQGLLLQLLYPHARTVLIEISKRAAEIGEELRRWLGVPSDRVEWVVDDVLNVSAAGFDFVYLYRPVRPEGPGREFYTRFAREVEAEEKPPIIFSIADCLRGFLTNRYEMFFANGHLTIFIPEDVADESEF